jgi:hypothetical protein
MSTTLGSIVNILQFQMFPLEIKDVIANFGGVTQTKLVRAEDALTYVVKDDIPIGMKVRASEYFWLNLARSVGLPAPQVQLLKDSSGRLLSGTRRELSSLEQNMAISTLLTGSVVNGGIQLSRIFAFDLFSGNWDRHFQNYLILQEPGGTHAVLAIDFSHVFACPNLATPDPVIEANCSTRRYIAALIAQYGFDRVSATVILERLRDLNFSVIEDILSNLPQEWLSDVERAPIKSWWNSPERQVRSNKIIEGFINGIYF